MKTITVYRVDPVRNTWIPIGGVPERRSYERGNNLLGLRILARKWYSFSPEDGINIAIDDLEARKQQALIRF